ncbi:hypothetical protein [Mesorhizobium sp. B1-1-8]|nr:hypothetical protein [Mesorhizobium sp. B1-1-8]
MMAETRRLIEQSLDLLKRADLKLILGASQPEIRFVEGTRPFAR